MIEFKFFETYILVFSYNVFFIIDFNPFPEGEQSESIKSLERRDNLTHFF